MIVTKKHFNSYRQTILTCIDSCTNLNQLDCCWDMFERFRTIFIPLVDVKHLIASSNEIMDAYLEKQTKLMV